MGPVEFSPDDPREVAEGIRRASEGARVHLVRDGRVVADIVPAEPKDDTASSGVRPPRDPRHAEINNTMADRFGRIPLESYRRVFAEAGRPWPGDDYIRRNYDVGDPS